ncbi:MAG: low specificity L-threonine aldolase [Deltaproteobacteria bacterium]|nr:low specificity L-threonine aldolase [Deltaproteobacteria bacterium]
MTRADLRSDTLTKPTDAMLAVMMAAEVGDDVFGEDPTVARLEAETARILGKEAAMFVPSGTMANQIAIQLHTRPGDTVIAEEGAHILRFEAGAAAALAGVQIECVPRAAALADDVLIANFRPESLHTSATALLVVENTHNVGGGRVLSLAAMERIGTTAKSLGLAVHCDGARLWNAAVALGTSEAQLVAHCDTVAVCLSKGLGAPVGSVLVGSATHMVRARKLRKRAGGGMRQGGYLAAAGLYALAHHRSRLAADHRAAARMAAILREAVGNGCPLEVMYPDPGTNMVYVRLTQGSALDHERALAKRGVRMIAMGGGWLRAVFYLGVDQSAAELAASELVALSTELRR